MEVMNKIRNIILFACLLIGVSSCELFGLDFSEGADYDGNVPDNNVNMSAWEFMKAHEDLFSSMMEAIEYAELEYLYTEPGNTYILLTNTALTGTGSTSYWSRELVEVDGEMVRPGAWSQYPKKQIVEMLSYHVVKGEYSFHNLTSVATWCKTFGEGTFDYVKNGETLQGDTAVLSMVVAQDRTLPLQLNNYSWNYRGELKPTSGSCRTTNLKLTNGYAHVTDYYLERPSRKFMGQE